MITVDNVDTGWFEVVIDGDDLETLNNIADSTNELADDFIRDVLIIALKSVNNN